MEVAQHGRAQGFFHGFSYPFRGARFVFLKHRGLAKFWLMPIVLTLAALGAVIWLSVSFHEAFAEQLWATPVGEGWFDSLLLYLRRLLGWLIALALISAGAIVVLLSTSVIAAPFNDALSEAVETIRSGRPAVPFSPRRALRDLRRTLRLEFYKWLLYAAIMGPLLIMNWLIPGPGSLLYLIAGTSITALFFAVDYLDFAAARHGLSVRERVRFARSHLRPVMGLGFGIWVLLFVPLINLLFMPAAVAGGTLLFLDLHEHQTREASSNR